MKKKLAAVASALALVASPLAVVAATQAPASAACEEGVYYVTKAKGAKYRPSKMRSDWANGGQRVTVRKGTSVKSGVTTIKSGTHNIDVGASWGPIQASYNYTRSKTTKVTEERRFTLSTSYSARVPNGKQARQMRWQRKMRIAVVKKRMQRSCDVVVVGRALVEAPMAQRSFVWDFQDKNGLPGCKVRGYDSFGAC
jgi:hypothetical protein